MNRQWNSIICYGKCGTARIGRDQISISVFSKKQQT